MNVRWKMKFTDTAAELTASLPAFTRLSSVSIGM